MSRDQLENDFIGITTLSRTNSRICFVCCWSLYRHLHFISRLLTLRSRSLWNQLMWWTDQTWVTARRAKLLMMTMMMKRLLYLHPANKVWFIQETTNSGLTDSHFVWKFPMFHELAIVVIASFGFQIQRMQSVASLSLDAVASFECLITVWT